MSADLLPPMKWNAWGDPQHAKPLSEGIRALLTQALGVTGPSETELDADQVRLRPSELTTQHHKALAAIVGPIHCRTGNRKSTRLNSSHANISYAVFCLKK